VPLALLVMAPEILPALMARRTMDLTTAERSSPPASRARNTPLDQRSN